MYNILIIQGGGRSNGNTSRLKAFIERFYCIAEEYPDLLLGRYEKYPVKDCALLMTAADDYFWTFEQAVSYYQFAVVNYIGFKDKGMVLAGECGDTNGSSQIDRTRHLQERMNLESAFILINLWTHTNHSIPTSKKIFQIHYCLQVYIACP